MVSISGKGTYSPSLCEESYDELQMLMREMMYDEGLESKRGGESANTKLALGTAPRRVNIASGDDLFNEHGESLYGCV